MRFVTLSVCAVLAMAQPAWAQSPKGYLTAGIGAGYTTNGELNGAVTDAGVDFDLGRPIAMLAAGFSTPGDWRFELDASQHYNDAEVLYFKDRPDLQPNAKSQVSARSLMVNLIREFDVDGWLHPYLGAGLGKAWIDYEIQEYITDVQVLDDDDATLAYQLIAGFGLTLTPKLDLQLDYRYWRAPDIELTDVAGTPLETDYPVHSAMMSLRYHPWGGATGEPPRPSTPRYRGWYAQVLGGASSVRDAEIKDNIANFDGFSLGGAALLAVGVGWRDRWQFELELAGRRNDATIIDFNPEFGEARADGEVRSRSLMANFRYLPQWHPAFEPYVVVGAGLASAQWDVSLHADGATYVDDEDSALAAQLAIGIAGQLGQRLGVVAEYRVWSTAPFDMTQPDGRPLRTQLTVTSVLLGLRYELR